jgi:SAM-dependent methyltransferase
MTTPEPPEPPAQPPPPSFAAELGHVLYPEQPPVVRETLARLAGTYTETIRRAGIRPEAVLWQNRNSQAMRFRKLLLVLGKDALRPGLTINDLGCGYGALFDHIRRKPFLKGGRYVGYDLSPEMVEAARDQHRADPRATFVCAAEATEEADYSFASGTFGLMLEESYPAWEAYVRDCLRRLAAKSRRGMAFNLLDRRGPDFRDTLYYGDPAEYLAFCREELGARATVLDTYTPYDFTILCRFDGQDPPAGRVKPRSIRWWRRWLPWF